MNDISQRFGLPWWLSPIGSTIGVPFPGGRQDQESQIGSSPTMWAAGSALPMPPLPIHSVDQNRGVLGSLNPSAHGGLLGPLTSPLGHLGSAAPWDAAYAYLHGSSPAIAGSDALSLTTPVPAQDAITQPATDAISQAQSSQRRKPRNFNPSPAQTFKDDIEPSTLVQTLSDVAPDNYWMPGEDYAGGGHHEFPRAHYKRMPPETQKVFDAAKSGPLFVIVNGRRHEFDRFHRQYNEATAELLKFFMENRNIAGPEQMTPDHARTLLRAIAVTNDPRIQSYREFIRLLRLFPWLRGGARGSE